MRQIVLQDNKYVIAFSYSPAIVSDVKLIPGRSFDYATKLWSAPVDSKPYIDKLASKYNFNFRDESVPPVFRNFDYTIPEMPKLQVDIPLKRELFTFQKTGVQYILDKKRLIIGDQMGLGKTGQAIAALAATGAYPALIICPASLRLNWQREIEIWTGKKSMILSDTIKNTWTYFYEAKMCDIFIVNYESLKKYFESHQ